MKLYWNDPEQIKGNDYKVITYDDNLDDETAFITYNNGLSEANVYISELEII